MLLQSKHAVIYGGGGAIGGAVARAFAREEGAKVFLAGRTLARLDEVADFAAFVASDRAGATTGAIANLTCGSLVD